MKAGAVGAAPRARAGQAPGVRHDAVAAPHPRLSGIRAVTSTVPDLEAIEHAYVRWLRYRVVARERLPPEVAAAWGAPAVAGRRVLTLAPPEGTVAWLRFVESPLAAGWRALTTWGWNVTELVVADVDALAESFAGSPFTIVGPPTSLTRFPMIRAMQVLGPGGECLYCTQVGAGSGLELARAEAWVGRAFIVVAGGPDVGALFAPYARFANEQDPPVATPVRVLSRQNGLPAETPHRHGLVKLGGGTLLELDEYPSVTRARVVPPGELPPGMALVSLGVDALPGGAPAHAAFLPGVVARAQLLRGGAGELVELVETPHG